MSEWLLSFGYLGAFIGAMMEGEIMLMAAIQAARIVPALHIYGMIGCFFIGTLTTDWSLYWIGRKRGRYYVSRSPAWEKRFERMNDLFTKRSWLLLFSYRFMYGFRIMLPLLFGVTNVPPARFMICSLCGTIIWISCFSILGYYFAAWAMASPQRLIGVGLVVVLSVVVTGLYRYGRQQNDTATPEAEHYS